MREKKSSIPLNNRLTGVFISFRMNSFVISDKIYDNKTSIQFYYNLKLKNLTNSLESLLSFRYERVT